MAGLASTKQCVISVTKQLSHGCWRFSATVTQSLTSAQKRILFAAGAQYISLSITVELKTSAIDSAVIPWLGLYS